MLRAGALLRIGPSTALLGVVTTSAVLAAPQRQRRNKKKDKKEETERHHKSDKHEDKSTSATHREQQPLDDTIVNDPTCEGGAKALVSEAASTCSTTTSPAIASPPRRHRPAPDPALVAAAQSSAPHLSPGDMERQRLKAVWYGTHMTFPSSDPIQRLKDLAEAAVIFSPVSLDPPSNSGSCKTTNSDNLEKHPKTASETKFSRSSTVSDTPLDFDIFYRHAFRPLVQEVLRAGGTTTIAAATTAGTAAAATNTNQSTSNAPLNKGTATDADGTESGSKRVVEQCAAVYAQLAAIGHGFGTGAMRTTTGAPVIDAAQDGSLPADDSSRALAAAPLLVVHASSTSSQCNASGPVPPHVPPPSPYTVLDPNLRPTLVQTLPQPPLHGPRRGDIADVDNFINTALAALVLDGRCPSGAGMSNGVSDGGAADLISDDNSSSPPPNQDDGLEADLCAQLLFHLAAFSGGAASSVAALAVRAPMTPVGEALMQPYHAAEGHGRRSAAAPAFAPQALLPVHPLNPFLHADSIGDPALTARTGGSLGFSRASCGPRTRQLTVDEGPLGMWLCGPRSQQWTPFYLHHHPITIPGVGHPDLALTSGAPVAGLVHAEPLASVMSAATLNLKWCLAYGAPFPQPTDGPQNKTQPPAPPSSGIDGHPTYGQCYLHHFALAQLCAHDWCGASLLLKVEPIVTHDQPEERAAAFMQAHKNGPTADTTSSSSGDGGGGVGSGLPLRQVVPARPSLRRVSPLALLSTAATTALFLEGIQRTIPQHQSSRPEGSGILPDLYRLFLAPRPLLSLETLHGDQAALDDPGVGVQTAFTTRRLMPVTPKPFAPANATEPLSLHYVHQTVWFPFFHAFAAVPAPIDFIHGFLLFPSTAGGGVEHNPVRLLVQDTDPIAGSASNNDASNSPPPSGIPPPRLKRTASGTPHSFGDAFAGGASGPFWTLEMLAVYCSRPLLRRLEHAVVRRIPRPFNGGAYEDSATRRDGGSKDVEDDNYLLRNVSPVTPVLLCTDHPEVCDALADLTSIVSWDMDGLAAPSEGSLRVVGTTNTADLYEAVMVAAANGSEAPDLLPRVWAVGLHPLTFARRVWPVIVSLLLENGGIKPASNNRKDQSHKGTTTTTTTTAAYVGTIPIRTLADQLLYTAEHGARTGTALAGLYLAAFAAELAEARAATGAEGSEVAFAKEVNTASPPSKAPDSGGAEAAWSAAFLRIVYPLRAIAVDAAAGTSTFTFQE